MLILKELLIVIDTFIFLDPMKMIKALFNSFKMNVERRLAKLRKVLSILELVKQKGNYKNA